MSKQQPEYTRRNGSIQRIERRFPTREGSSTTWLNRKAHKRFLRATAKSLGIEAKNIDKIKIQLRERGIRV